MNTPGKKPIEWPAWTKSNRFLGLLTLVLWLVSAAFSFYALLETQQTILRHLTDGETISRWGYHVVRQWSSIFLVGIWMARSGVFQYLVSFRWVRKKGNPSFVWGKNHHAIMNDI